MIYLDGLSDTYHDVWWYSPVHNELKELKHKAWWTPMNENVKYAIFSLIKTTDEQWERLMQTTKGKKRIIYNLNLIKEKIPAASRTAFEVAINNIISKIIEYSPAGVFQKAGIGIKSAVTEPFKDIPEAIEDSFKKVIPLLIMLGGMTLLGIFLYIRAK